MAKKILIDYNFAQNEAQNVKVQNLSSAPGSPVPGQIYYDTTLHQFGYWNGTAWVYAGSGSGDVSSNTTSSVDSEVVVFNGTGGKSVKRATITGLAKLTSGVLSAAVAGTDYYNPGGTDVAVADGGTGASTAAGARTNLGLVIGTDVLAPNGNGSALTGITESQVANLTTDLGAKAPLASPALTGTPTAPTASAGANSTQIATTAYVDAATTAAANGFDVKASVRVATTAPITLSGTQSIDGVTVVAGDRVLVKNQSTASANGIYVVAAGAWSRASDADSSAEVTSGLYTFVSEGTANGDSGWYLTTDDPITLGSTSLTFTQFTGLGQVTAGTGLSKSANTLSIDTTVTVDKTTAQALTNKDLTGAGNTFPTFNQNTTGSAAKLTTPRNINGVAFDGTANITIPGNKATGNLGDGSTTSIVITDGLGTIDKIAIVRDARTGAQVECDITYSSTQTTFGFAVAPASNAYKYVIFG